MKSKKGLAIGEFTIWWIIALAILLIGGFFIFAGSNTLNAAKEFIINTIGLG